MKSSTLISQIIISAIMIGTGCVTAQVTFSRIASSAVTAPGGAPFSNTRPPAYRNGRAVFLSSPSGEGIYLKDGPTYTKCADHFTTFPGGTSGITAYGSLVAPTEAITLSSDGTVAFLGHGGGASGICIFKNGILSTAASTNTPTPIPSGTGNFTGFGDPQFDAATGLLLFPGGAPGQGGIFTSSSASMARIADRTYSNPGGAGLVASLANAAIHNGVAAVLVKQTGGTFPCVATGNGGPLTLIAGTATVAPNTAATFTEFSLPVISSGGVTFYGRAGSVTGLYTTIGGTLRRIVDSTQTYPGSATPFNFSGFPMDRWIVTASGNRVAFVLDNGTSPFESAIFVWDGDTNSLTKILKDGDAFDGGTASFFELHSQGLDGNNLAFKVAITGGINAGYAAYVATLGPTSAVGDWTSYE